MSTRNLLGRHIFPIRKHEKYKLRSFKLELVKVCLSHIKTVDYSTLTLSMQASNPLEAPFWFEFYPMNNLLPEVYKVKSKTSLLQYICHGVNSTVDHTTVEVFLKIDQIRSAFRIDQLEFIVKDFYKWKCHYNQVTKSEINSYIMH